MAWVIWQLLGSLVACVLSEASRAGHCSHEPPRGSDQCTKSQHLLTKVLSLYCTLSFDLTWLSLNGFDWNRGRGSQEWESVILSLELFQHEQVSAWTSLTRGTWCLNWRHCLGEKSVPHAESDMTSLLIKEIQYSYLKIDVLLVELMFPHRTS